MRSEKTQPPVSVILKAQELLQIDEAFIRRLREKDPDALAALSLKLANDLKEAMERLNQNPSNSSKPSGSLAPWDKGGADDASASLDISDTVEDAETLERSAEASAAPADSVEKNVPQETAYTGFTETIPTACAVGRIWCARLPRHPGKFSGYRPNARRATAEPLEPRDGCGLPGP